MCVTKEVKNCGYIMWIMEMVLNFGFSTLD